MEALKKKPKEQSELIAKRDFKIVHPSEGKVYKREIKAGEDLSDVPEIYHANLKTEGVI